MGEEGGSLRESSDMGVFREQPRRLGCVSAFLVRRPEVSRFLILDQERDWPAPRRFRLVLSGWDVGDRAFGARTFGEWRSPECSARFRFNRYPGDRLCGRGQRDFSSCLPP